MIALPLLSSNVCFLSGAKFQSTLSFNPPATLPYLFFPFPFLDIDIFQNFYVAFSPSLHLFSPLLSFPSWNVILLIKYDRKLKCLWWSIALLDFHSCQWLKLTNSETGISECFSPLGLVLSGILEVWVPHSSLQSVSHQESTSKECQQRSLKSSTADALENEKKPCVCVYTRAEFRWRAWEEGDIGGNFWIKAGRRTDPQICC